MANAKANHANNGHANSESESESESTGKHQPLAKAKSKQASCATVVETQREREIMWNMMFGESEVLCNQHMMSNMCDTWSSITDNKTACFSSDLRCLAACRSLRRLPMPVNASQHSPLHVPTSSQAQVARTPSADVHSPCRRESVSSGADVHTHCEAR